MVGEIATTSTPWLTIAILVPIVSGLIILLVGRDDKPELARWLSVIGATLGVLVVIPLYTEFDISTADMQFVHKVEWFSAFNAYYHVGVDGISLWYVILSAVITWVVIIAGWGIITYRVAQYKAAFLILSGIMIGVFAALDGLLFYVFFEATLIPMYLIIGIWGGPNRVYAAVKFFLYTLLGSLLLLVAFLYLYHQTGTFNILQWHQYRLGYEEQILLFLAFLASFAVKVPMWPVHTWLPDAHPEAPTGGSAVLAPLMLKLGAYGFLRFSLPITPDASHELAGLMIALSLVAIVYIGLVAMVQTDLKKLVAYSSISHMGFVTLGFFIFDISGMKGGLVQMVSHGFVSAAMFLAIGVLHDRMHSLKISDYGGVINRMPRFVTFFVLFCMANAGLPGTSGFVGEFMVILGALQFNFWIGLLTAVALILGAAYTLWMLKRVAYGPITNEAVGKMKDIDFREFLTLGLLAIMVLYMGLYPKPFTDVMNMSVQHLLEHVQHSKLL
jgi:NADH-quinone oxidoreductase subunit M